MDFELNEEQRFLAESVERFLNERYDFEARRAIVNADTDSSASEAVWSQLAEMGVLTIPISEAGGGFGGGAGGSSRGTGSPFPDDLDDEVPF